MKVYVKAIARLLCVTGLIWANQEIGTQARGWAKCWECSTNCPPMLERCCVLVSGQIGHETCTGMDNGCLVTVGTNCRENETN